MAEKTLDATQLNRSLGLFSATTIVAGSMVGSGIFIVSADIARQLPSGGSLILIWLFTAIVTLLGAYSYGKLAAHLPKAGGQYVFLKEAWGNIPGFLYGWAFFWVIQTGTVAAIATGFAKYLGVLMPAVSSDQLFLLGSVSITMQKLVAIAVILGLTAFNTTGVQSGAWLQNIFTSLKVLALVLLVLLGLGLGQHLHDGTVNWSLQAVTSLPQEPFSVWLYLPAFAVATVGALFSADCWNNVTFIGGEVKDPQKNLPKALTLGVLVVVGLYILVNLAYLNLLPFSAIQNAPEDRVATVAMQALFGPAGSLMMAGIILISTFGCLNGFLLSGARVFYAMATDGLLLKAFARLNSKTQSPNVSLWAQGIWASLLAVSGSYGQLLDYTIFTGILFYVLTMLGLLKLGRQNPEALRMTRWYDKLWPSLYIVLIGYIGLFLLLGPSKWVTSAMGLGLTLTGLPVYLWMQRCKQNPDTPREACCPHV